MRFVNYYPSAISDRSGVTAALWGWAAALVDAGQEVEVIHNGGERRSPPPGFDRPNLRDRAIQHRGRGRTTFRPVGLEHLLKAGDVLILHDGWVLSNLIAARAARRAGVPYIVVPHGAYEPGILDMLKPPRAGRDIVERNVLAGAAAIHVFFDTEIPLVRAIAPRISCAIVAPTGFIVGPERWRGGGGYLAWIGRYDPNHKGLDVLLEGLSLLDRDSRPRLELRGPDYKGGYARTLRLIDQFDLRDSVVAGGPVHGPAKWEFLLDAAGYVMPSRWESHSIALVENLALGVPCLVSTGMHIARPLQDADAAILADPSATGLADGLRRLAAADPHLGKRGRLFVERSLAWPTVTTQFLDGVDNALRAEASNVKDGDS
jgi:glycosyltransferase involved in cell wall biosynthesis